MPIIPQKNNYKYFFFCHRNKNDNYRYLCQQGNSLQLLLIDLVSNMKYYIFITRYSSIYPISKQQLFQNDQKIRIHIQQIKKNYKTLLFEMSIENQVQICSNCNKGFPPDKIDLHQAYCCRNIRKCQQCDMMIDIKDIDDHNNQHHTKKLCTMCNQQFPPPQLIKHQQICNRRPMLCQFCQNLYGFQQFSKHEEMCGARTKPCTFCHRLIILKDINNHQSKCNRRNQQRRQQRNQVSQDSYIPRQRQQAQRIDRDRQNSTNNLRNQPDRPNTIQNTNITKPHKIKPCNIIGPQLIKSSLDPIPISIKITMKQKQQRFPLKNKN